jgi:hypothetical protein
MNGRTYRFAPLDHKAWIFGLAGTQCLVLGGGLTASATLLRLPIPLLLASAPVLVAVAVAFVPIGPAKAYELAGTRFAFLQGRPGRPWLAPIPLFTSPADERKTPPPPNLAGVEIREVARPDWAGQAVRGVAVIQGEGGLDATAVVRARANGFALASRGDQDRSLAAWGDVLSSFCSEASAVSRLVASEHAGPADLTEARAWIHDHGAAATHHVRRDYDDLLAEVGERAAAHEVLITLTVDRRRAKGDLDAALLAETRRLVERLDAAGVVGTVLTPQEVAVAVATRMDPTRTLAACPSLVDASGLAPVSPWPLSQRVRWTDVRTDGAVHRAWWIAEWPRLDVGAAWLDPLLSTRAARRTVVLFFEPVAPSTSRRRIERDATRLATDAEQRANRGFRVGARHHRSRDAVEEREAELVAGYAEVGVVGLVVATAVTDNELDAAATQIGQAANAASLELRQLDGRHDLALAASLPLGRPIQERRL